MVDSTTGASSMNCPHCGNPVEIDLQTEGDEFLCTGGPAPCGKTWERGMVCHLCKTGPTNPNPFNAAVKSCVCGEVAWL